MKEYRIEVSAVLYLSVRAEDEAQAIVSAAAKMKAADEADFVQEVEDESAFGAAVGAAFFLNTKARDMRVVDVTEVE